MKYKIKKFDFSFYFLHSTLYFLCLTLLTGCVTTGMSPVKAGPVGLGVGVDCQSCRQNASYSDESEVGQKIHQEIIRSFRPYTEPDVVNYVNHMAKDIAGKAERKDLPYEVTILYNEQIYATSAPGGKIYLTTGFLYFLDNEAELAGVLAHEIGQLQYKDPKLSKSKQVLSQIINTGSTVAPAFGEIGMLAVLGLAMIKATTDGRRLSSDQRLLKADALGMNYMTEAGYDPQGLIDILYKMLEAHQQLVPYFKEYYEARPITLERMTTLQQVFKELPIQDRTFTTNREQYLEMTKGVREIYKQAR